MGWLRARWRCRRGRSATRRPAVVTLCVRQAQAPQHQLATLGKAEADLPEGIRKKNERAKKNSNSDDDTNTSTKNEENFLHKSEQGMNTENM